MISYVIFQDWQECLQKNLFGLFLLRSHGAYFFIASFLNILSENKGDKFMLGVYNYTVVLTYIGMLFSFVGITFVWNGDVKSALACLMISGLCDMFDGKIASTKKRTVQEKRFGIQIDSLSDLICFGVFPAIIIYGVSEKDWITIPVCAFYVLCALIRLAYFNVDEEERQNCTEGGRTVYLGLPVTTAALVIPAVIYIADYGKLSGNIMNSIVLAVIGIGFITPFQIKKPGITGKFLLMMAGIVEFLVVIVR